jgi:hypothetical protein
MDKKSELEVIRKFRQAVDRETLPEDVKVTCRISGGMPSERVEEEFRLSGVGTAGASARDVLRSVSARSRLRRKGKKQRSIFWQTKSKEMRKKSPFPG